MPTKIQIKREKHLGIYMDLVIKKIDLDFSICKVNSINADMLKSEFCFIGKTDEELSLVCPAADVPSDVICRDDGWRAFRIEGVLDFSLTGILSPIADLMAENNIGIFALSTYNTDYVLVKSESYEKALCVLADNGYTVK